MRYSKPLALYSMLYALCTSLFAQWVETTQKDFADGTFEHNIYASHREYRDSLPGAIEFVQRFDYNNDGWMDVAVSNVGPYIGGPHRETAYVYLQYPEGGFLKGEEYRRLSYPTGAASVLLGADLNTDGFSELIVQNFWYYPNMPDSQGGISVFWGIHLGPDPTDYDSLGPAYMLGSCAGIYVADLNKDGWLDIIGGMYPGYKDFSIFWGSKNGYSETNITTIKIPEEYPHPCHNFEIADFDRDGYYDIVVTCFVMWSTSPTRTRPAWLIYWGSSAGYSDEEFTKFSVDDVQAHGATVADLNNDGWLDIVCTTYRSGLRGQPGFTDMDTARAVVYYGLGNREFSKDSTVLRPGYCFGGSAAADLYPRGAPDGWLDLIFFVGNIDEGHPQGAYKEHLWLYYGGPHGFSDSRREPLEAIGARNWSTSGGLIADFNIDGYQDVFINDWVTLNGYSAVLYGPDFSQMEELPNRTDHHGTIWELGNAYDRKYYEEYSSSVYDAKGTVNWGEISIIDSCPPGSKITMAIRTGDVSIPDNSWSDWYRLSSLPDTIPDTLNSRFIQYKATLSYANPAHLPILYEVRMEYDPVGQPVDILIEPDLQTGTLVHARVVDSIDYNLWGTNLGNGPDTIDLFVRDGRGNKKPEGRTDVWSYRLLQTDRITPLQDTDGDSIPDLGVMRPGGLDTVHFITRIIAPDTVYPFSADTTLIWGYSSIDTMIKDPARLITAVPPLGIKETPDSLQTLRIIEVSPIPSKGVVSVKWQVADEGPISLEVYDATGRLVRILLKATGLEHRAKSITWDGRDDEGKILPSGIYFCELRAGDYRVTKKMILMK